MRKIIACTILDFLIILHKLRVYVLRGVGANLKCPFKISLPYEKMNIHI